MLIPNFCVLIFNEVMKSNSTRVYGIRFSAYNMSAASEEKAPLCITARWKRPLDAAIVSWHVTESAPADSPPTVTREGSPPNCPTARTPQLLSRQKASVCAGVELTVPLDPAEGQALILQATAQQERHSGQQSRSEFESELTSFPSSRGSRLAGAIARRRESPAARACIGWPRRSVDLRRAPRARRRRCHPSR